MVKIQAMHFCSETINNIFYSKIEDMTYIVKKKKQFAIIIFISCREKQV